MDQGPIFVTGPDRSGTSLMFALLASHPNISMVRRSNMWRWFYGQFGDISKPENFERCLNMMLRYRRLKHLEPNPERIREEFWQGKPSYGRLFSLFHVHHAQRSGKDRWGDKSLHAEHEVEQILSEFPGAKIIHMIRDPRDRYASVIKRYEGNEKGIASATGRWLASAKKAIDNVQTFSDNYLTVRYESLAQNPEAVMKKTCAFIDAPYTPVMLAMEGAPAHGQSGGNSSFSKFKPGTISTRSLGRFRQVLTKQQIAFIQICAGRHMVAFDYPLEAVHFSIGNGSLFYAFDLPSNLFRMAGWLTINKIQSIKGKTIPSHHLVNNNHE